MEKNKAYGMLGFAAKARKIAFGAQAVEQAIRRGKARLVVVDEALSEKSYDKLQSTCEREQIPIVRMAGPGHAAGKPSSMCMAVVDANFAEQIINRTDLADVGGRICPKTQEK